MPASLRKTLRESTDTAHRALEAQVEGHRLLADAAGYEAFLVGWYRLQCAVETALDAAGASRVIPDWSERRRAGLIAQDLATLAVPLPAAAAMLQVTSEAEILGTAYVVEGATLGAQSVRPAIKQLGAPASGALRFLSGPAGGAGPQWRSFLEVLERWSPRVDHDEAAAAARRTFGLASELLVLREARR